MSEDRLRTFFEEIFGQQRGYLSLGYDVKGVFKGNRYFDYPNDLPKAIQFIMENRTVGNVWFCNQLLKHKKRVKSSVIDQCTFIWADLDECPPQTLPLPPTIVIRSSPGHFQGIWMLAEPIPPAEAEEISHRIYAAHKDDGVDKCWNLARLMRIPFTYNHKYDEIPEVVVDSVHTTNYTSESFDVFPEIDETVDFEIKLPASFPQESPEEILAKVKSRVSPTAWEYLRVAPAKDWSSALWHLIKSLQETGLSNEEVFVVTAKCPVNKYVRDKNPAWKEYLWRDICKAAVAVEDFGFTKEERMKPEILTPLERTQVEAVSSIIDSYVEWASLKTDAPLEYHTSGAFMLLSCLLSSAVRVESSIGNIPTNLWMLILGETTITRKSTAMKLARDIVMEIDPGALLATDGTYEGIVKAMETRSNRASLFYKDEFSSFLSGIIKKDYMSGMVESMILLYDGDIVTRKLTKGDVTVVDPVFILYGGGIRERILESLTHDHVYGGFIPRFLFVVGRSDHTKLRPIGPAVPEVKTQRRALVQKFTDIYNAFNPPGKRKVKTITATQEAWDLMALYHGKLLNIAKASPTEDLLNAVFERTIVSGIKMAGLLAASEFSTTIGESEMRRAFYYIEKWLPHTMHVVDNIGITVSERQIQHTLRLIRTKDGVNRSYIMRTMKLTARNAKEIIETLEQRGEIHVDKTHITPRRLQ